MTDWTDYRRSNPELEATRDRWNARFCRAPEPTERPSLRPHFIVLVCAVLLVGTSLIASIH